MGHVCIIIIMTVGLLTRTHSGGLYFVHLSAWGTSTVKIGPMEELAFGFLNISPSTDRLRTVLHSPFGDVELSRNHFFGLVIVRNFSRHNVKLESCS